MQNKRYEITIVEMGIEEEPAGHEWVKGGTEHQNDAGYGYTPQIMSKKKVRREVYVQNIEWLDISKVIKAVNDL